MPDPGPKTNPAGWFSMSAPGARKLRGVRGKLSIIACILTLGHNIIYGKKHFVMLFTNPSEMKLQAMIAAIISIVMIAVMLPLMVTSFKAIRVKMRGEVWKKLQRLAYAFFALIYVHVMVLFLPRFEKKWMDIVLYTVIFGVYLVLRVAKAARKPAHMSAGCGA